MLPLLPVAYCKTFFVLMTTVRFNYLKMCFSVQDIEYIYKKNYDHAKFTSLNKIKKSLYKVAKCFIKETIYFDRWCHFNLSF